MSSIEDIFVEFNNLASIKYLDQLNRISQQLPIILPITHICLYTIFNRSDAFLLSNLPEWAIYYQMQLDRIEQGVFKLNSYKDRDYFLPDLHITTNSSLHWDLINIKIKSYYKVFSMLRKSQECWFIFLAFSKQPIQDVQTFYERHIHRFEDYCVLFLNQTHDIIIKDNPSYKEALIFRHIHYRQAVITRSRVNHIGAITRREHDILRSIVAGNNINQTAHNLGIQVKTIYNHLENIREKMQVSTTKEAIKVALDLQLIDPLR